MKTEENAEKIIISGKGSIYEFCREIVKAAEALKAQREGGRKGGKSCSPAKAAAVRENAKKARAAKLAKMKGPGND